jgi:hypothetical protein
LTRNGTNLSSHVVTPLMSPNGDEYDWIAIFTKAY